MNLFSKRFWLHQREVHHSRVLETKSAMLGTARGGAEVCLSLIARANQPCTLTNLSASCVVAEGQSSRNPEEQKFDLFCAQAAEISFNTLL